MRMRVSRATMTRFDLAKEYHQAVPSLVTIEVEQWNVGKGGLSTESKSKQRICDNVKLVIYELVNVSELAH